MVNQVVRTLDKFFIELTQTMRTEHLIALAFIFIVDFLTGITASKITGKKIKSSKWIDGLLRKVSIFLALFGVGIVSVLLEKKVIFVIFYGLFMLGELKSIFENMANMGIPRMEEITNMTNVLIDHVIRIMKEFFEKFDKGVGGKK